MDENQINELYEAILKTFERKLKQDKTIKYLKKKISSETATMLDAKEYALTAGQYLEEAIRSCVNAEALPDGKMVYEIADKIIGNPLRYSKSLVDEVCSSIQLAENIKSGIGLKPVIPPQREETIKAVISKISAAETYSEKILKEAVDIPTWSLQDVDSFIKNNTDFMNRSGIRMLIIRTYEGKHFDPHRGKGGSMQDCKFCMQRATDGWVDYDSVDRDEIFRRHVGCRCEILTKKSGEKIQSAWSKEHGESVRDLYNSEQARLRSLDNKYKKIYQQRIKEKQQINGK